MPLTCDPRRVAALFLLVVSGCVTPSSSSPEDSATATSNAALPAELRYLWLGENAFIHFMTDGTLGYTEDDSWQVSAVDEDVIELRAIEDAGGCNEGDVGRYGWTFS